MKKFLLILVVLSLFGCSSPVVDVPEEVLTFEEAVQEIYEMTGRTLFYSKNGITIDEGKKNRVSGPNEIPGVCTDYALEFAYYWNEVKNYDELFGKAYLSLISTGTSNNSIVYFLDINFVPDGTVKYREETGNFASNADAKAADGVYRDAIVSSIIYSGKNILHFGDYQRDHMWTVIKIGSDWYDTDPSWWDITTYANFSNEFAPVKIIF